MRDYTAFVTPFFNKIRATLSLPRVPACRLLGRQRRSVTSDCHDHVDLLSDQIGR
jgi:hypothetical protein